MAEASRNNDQTHPLHPSATRPEYYEIRIKGHLDLCWSEWFEGLTMTIVEGGETILSGPVADQAALHGLLAKVRDLNLKLISVNRIGVEQLPEEKEEVQL